jgi:hypothetical protein
MQPYIIIIIFFDSLIYFLKIFLVPNISGRWDGYNNRSLDCYLVTSTI